MVVKYETVEGFEQPTFIAIGYHLPDTDAAVRLTGQLEQNGKYGLQLKVVFTEINPPDTEDEFVRYVSSLNCSFGPKRAKRLYNLLGAKAWEKIENNDLPKAAEKIAGADALERLCKKVNESTVERDLIRVLANKVSVDIAELRRKDVTAMAIKLNPYILCMHGVSFQSADEFALSEGYATPDSPKRIESALHAALKNAALRGSSCLPGQLLLRGDRKRGIEGALTMLNRKGFVVSEDMAHGVLMNASSEKRIILNSGFFYSRESYWEEVFVAKKLFAMANTKISRKGEAKYNKAIEKYEKEEGIELSDEQRQTVLGIGKDNVMVVTGYPGAGKTTTIKAILSVLQEAEGITQEDILLLSPTGRAARRMEETTGAPASTILSALGYTGRNTDEILKDDWAFVKRYIIVDELSMVDLQQMAMLLKHIGNNTQLIMIGDPDQLPSVGAGNVLHDIIISGEVPVYRLVKIFRQKSSANINPIPQNAAQIRNGKTDLVWTRNPESAFIRAARDSEEDIFATAVSLYQTIVSKSELTVDDVAMLCPFRKKSGHTVLTSSALNQVLQERLNPVKNGETTMTAHGVVFHKGDKVMQLVNTEIAKNGDIGYIESIGMTQTNAESDKLEKCANINFNGMVVQYSSKELADVDLAYASSVHKMQGSETDTVILVISASHSPLLARNLVYTAITRAIKHVIVVGDISAFEKAIERDNTSDPDMARLTLLAARLHHEGQKNK